MCQDEASPTEAPWEAVALTHSLSRPILSGQQGLGAPALCQALGGFPSRL